MFLNELIDAARYGEVDTLRSLEEALSNGNGVDMDMGDTVSSFADWVVKSNEHGNTMLHMAAANGHADVIHYIKDVLGSSVKSRLDYVNRRNEFGNTALHWAAMNGHVTACDILLQLDADATIKNTNGHSPLFVAQENGREEVVNLLLDKAPIDVESEDDAAMEDEVEAEGGSQA